MTSALRCRSATAPWPRTPVRGHWLRRREFFRDFSSAHPAVPDRPGPIRPRVRARCLRGRLRGHPDRRPGPLHRGQGHGGAPQSRSPRRHRRRSEDGGRCGHLDAGAGRVPARRGRLQPAAAGGVRGRQRLPAYRSGAGRQGEGEHRADRRRGTPHRPGLASRAHERRFAERPDPFEHAALRATLRHPGRQSADGSGAGAAWRTACGGGPSTRPACTSPHCLVGR